MFPGLEKSGIDGEEMAEEIIQFKEDHKEPESASKKDEKVKSQAKSTSSRSAK